MHLEIAVVTTMVAAAGGGGGRRRRAEAAGEFLPVGSAREMMKKNLMAAVEVPRSFICPLTLEVMKDPATAADGHSYELEAIAKWLNTSSKSPLTGETLLHKQLTRSHALRNAIEEHAQATAARKQQLARVTSEPSVGTAETRFDVPLETAVDSKPDVNTTSDDGSGLRAGTDQVSRVEAQLPDLTDGVGAGEANQFSSGANSESRKGLGAEADRRPQGRSFDVESPADMTVALHACRKLVNAAGLRSQLGIFRRQNCDLFDEAEENKLEYTACHDAYIQLIDEELSQSLTSHIGRGFAMEAFLAALPGFLASGVADARDDDNDDEYERAATLPATLAVLRGLASFDSFKADMLAARRAKREEAERMAAGMQMYFRVAQPK